MRWGLNGHCKRDPMRRTNCQTVRWLSLVTVLSGLIMPISSCSLFSDVTKGYEPNQEVRSEVRRLRRGEIAAIEFVDFNMKDVDGKLPSVRVPALLNPLLDALSVAERASAEIIDPNGRLDLCDTSGRVKGSLSIHFPSADFYIGPRWTKALLHVREEYAAEARRRVSKWKPTDIIEIRHAEAPSPSIKKQRADTPLSAPASWGAEPIRLVAPGSFQSAKPEAGILTQPQDRAQIIRLLSSGDARLYAFDSTYRAALRIDRIREHHTETVYVVLPLIDHSRGELTFDESLIPLGTSRALLDKLSLILPRL